MSGKPLFGPVRKKNVGNNINIFHKILCAHVYGLSVVICVPKMTCAQKYKDDINGLVFNGLGKGLLSKGVPNYEYNVNGLEEDLVLFNNFFKNKLKLKDSNVEGQHDYPFVEPLCLCYEEAFHLLIHHPNEFYIYPSDKCHCCHLYDTDMLQTNEHLNLQQVWSIFCQNVQNFPLRFKVYSHFRDMGWVVKIGLKVGVDYLLYPFRGPDVSHAQFGVLIVTKDHCHSDSVFVALRVLHHLAKNLIVTLVTKIADDNFDQFFKEEFEKSFNIENLGFSRSA